MRTSLTLVGGAKCDNGIELQLVIPNHNLAFSESLLGQSLEEHMHGNLKLFIEYREKVSKGELE